MAARSYVAEARRRGLGSRRARIGPIVERLAEEHADAEIALRFESDVELLISVMLSAQTTDVNVNRVTERLFAKYRRPEDYLAVPQEELERDIFQTGFFRQKAKAIRGAMRVLSEDFGGRVPRTIPELLTLPGVARKTANVVAAELGDAQGIVVDTHVRRLSQRLGLTREEDPVKIERDSSRSSRGPTGTGSLISSSGTGAVSATRADPGARTACSPTSARRAGSRSEPRFPHRARKFEGRTLFPQLRRRLLLNCERRALYGLIQCCSRRPSP